MSEPRCIAVVIALNGDSSNSRALKNRDTRQLKAELRIRGVYFQGRLK